MLPLILLACQLGSVLSTEYPIKASVAIFKDAAFGSTTGMVESIGTVTFEQSKKDGEVKVTGTISGLKEGMHGFHIHERGDLFNGCADAKGHFNPDGVKHGGPKDAVRHVGDLGNVVSGADGITRFVITDNVISLLGRNSIIGRAVVVHEGKDDLGKGTGDAAAESQKTGNAGKRVGCGVVGVASAKYDSTDAMEAITTSARAVIFENKNFTGAPAKVLGSISLSIVGDHIKITGRSKSLTGGKHGFHVHDLGAIEGGCGGAKGHFNPKGVKHGGPTDAVRHVGDLGNVVAGADGFAHVDITDTAVKLGGWASVVGRAIVVHAGVDDLGKGTGAAAAGSQATGNAGARLGCGIIGIVESTPAPPRSAAGRGALAVGYGGLLLAVLVVALVGRVDG